MTTIAPSVTMIVLLAALSFNGALILNKPWMRRVAFGCGVFEIALIAVLVLTTW